MGLELVTQPDDPSCSRVVGGAVQIVNKLAAELNSETPNQRKVSLRLHHPVEAISRVANTGSEGGKIRLTCKGHGDVFAKQVVVAAPTKLAIKTLRFEPPLPADRVTAMQVSGNVKGI